VSRYDRVLASSEWGAKILVNGGRLDTDWLPHGIWRDKFHIRGDAKSLIGQKHGVLVGCVMANQQRKDYPVAFRCLGELRRDYGNNFNAWVHTDELIRYWNLPALAAEYGLGDCLEVTMDLTDEQLALRYSACDCTILPSGGEGFGFPIAESLACGTSCIVSDYAGGAELVPPPCRSKPVAYKVEGPHSVLRPVLDGQDFALLAKYQIEVKRDDRDHTAKDIAQTVDHLSWDNLRYEWTKWLVEGLT
jgi:glycosyltransferase involved in cell wall biosynthesis